MATKREIKEHSSGRGGKRKGAGRPQGTKKEPTKRVSLPLDIADWITSYFTKNLLDRRKCLAIC
jgi:hypothetical protein